MLSWADWGVIAAYLAAVVAVALVSARGQRDARDYFLGRRQLSWLPVGLSVVATETSALTFIGAPALAFGELRRRADGSFHTVGGNLRFLQIAIGYVIARALIAFRMVRHYFVGDVYTPYQILERGFSPGVRRLGASFALFNMCLQAGIRVYVTAIPLVIALRTVWPELSLWPPIVALLLLAIALASLGGIRAVVATDALQFFVFIGGGIYALVDVLSRIPVQAVTGVSATVTGWGAVEALAADKLSLFSWGLGGERPLATLLGGDFNIWMGLIGATFGVLVSHGSDQLNVQRLLACKSAGHARGALLLSAGIIAPQFLLFLLIGVALAAYYRATRFDFGGLSPWDPTALASTAPGVSQPKPKADYVFPIYIVTRMPHVVRGLMVAGILAAALSSLTSALTAISSVLLIDFRRPSEGERAEQAGGVAELGRARRVTALIAVALGVIAWLAKDAPLVFNMVFQFAGIFSGAKLGGIVLAMRGEEQRAAGVVSGMLASALAMAAVVIGGRAGVVALRWPWYAAVGTLTCISVAWAVEAAQRANSRTR